MAGALWAGNATAGTDTGHTGSPATGNWALGLTAPQIAGLRKVYEGAKNPRTGEQIFPGYIRGGEAGMFEVWLRWYMRRNETGIKARNSEGYFIGFELPGELRQHCLGSRRGTILEKFSGDPGISVMVASRSPSKNLGTNLGTVLVTGCSKCPVYAWGLPRILRRSFVFRWPLARWKS